MLFLIFMKELKESNQSTWSAKYDANNTKRIFLKLNKNTDKDIIEHLEGRNKQGYIKNLIRKDMSLQKIKHDC